MIQSYNKTNEMHKFLKFIFGIELYMFRTVSLSIIRRLALYTQQQVYVIQVMLTACQRDQDGIAFHPYPASKQLCSKNKFEKLVHLVGFNYKNKDREHFEIQHTFLTWCCQLIRIGQKSLYNLFLVPQTSLSCTCLCKILCNFREGVVTFCRGSIQGFAD